MDEVLTAIRNELVADGTLTAIVASGDIRFAYVEKDINYPCIVVEFIEYPSLAEFDSVFRGVVGISTWSEENNKQCIDVLNRVKALLHNQERNVADAGVAFHSIRYVGPGGGSYMPATDTWRKVANYAVLAEDV